MFLWRQDRAFIIHDIGENPIFLLNLIPRKSQIVLEKITLSINKAPPTQDNVCTWNHSSPETRRLNRAPSPRAFITQVCTTNERISYIYTLIASTTQRRYIHLKKQDLRRKDSRTKITPRSGHGNETPLCHRHAMLDFLFAYATKAPSRTYLYVLYKCENKGVPREREVIDRTFFVTDYIPNNSV